VCSRAQAQDEAAGDAVAGAPIHPVESADDTGCRCWMVVVVVLIDSEQRQRRRCALLRAAVPAAPVVGSLLWCLTVCATCGGARRSPTDAGRGGGGSRRSLARTSWLDGGVAACFVQPRCQVSGSAVTKPGRAAPTPPVRTGDGRSGMISLRV